MDYLSLSGYGTDAASRTDLAKNIGIENYSVNPGNANVNSDYLARLRAMQDGSSSGGITDTGAPGTGSTGTSTGNPGTPPAPAAPADPYADAFSKYIDSLQVSPEERQARDYLNSLVTQGKLDNEKALQSGETLGFATGEAARVNRNNAIMTDAASNSLNALTANREGDSAIAKAKADYLKGLSDKNAPFELSPGQVRYALNPATGKYEEVAAADAKTTLPASAQEYEYAKSQGYTGTYEQYQNADANRKAKAAGSTATETKAAQQDDVAEAVTDFQDQMRKRGWAGANPDAYAYYRDQLKKLYGASAALDLDAAMEKAGIVVDYKNK